MPWCGGILLSFLFLFKIFISSFFRLCSLNYLISDSTFTDLKCLLSSRVLGYWQMMLWFSHLDRWGGMLESSALVQHPVMLFNRASSGMKTTLFIELICFCWWQKLRLHNGKTYLSHSVNLNLPFQVLTVKLFLLSPIFIHNFCVNYSMSQFKEGSQTLMINVFI